MAKERTPYIDFEHGDDVYAFRLNAMDVAQLQGMVETPGGIIQALQAMRFDVIHAATLKGLSNPRNPRKMQNVARDAFNDDWQYCLEKVLEGLEAGGVFGQADEGEGDDENPTPATAKKRTKESTLTNSSD